MAFCRLDRWLCAALAVLAVSAFAQAPTRAPAVVPLDRVLVVVNDEAITQWDLGEQRRVMLTQLKASNITPPPSDVLDKQVIERAASCHARKPPRRLCTRVKPSFPRADAAAPPR